MLLTNKSQTAIFCGISPAEYGLNAEFGLVYPEAPERLELYQQPIKEGSKPIGIFKLASRPMTPSAFLNLPLTYYDLEQQVNNG